MKTADRETREKAAGKKMFMLNLGTNVLKCAKRLLCLRALCLPSCEGLQIDSHGRNVKRKRKNFACKQTCAKSVLLVRAFKAGKEHDDFRKEINNIHVAMCQKWNSKFVDGQKTVTNATMSTVQTAQKTSKLKMSCY